MASNKHIPLLTLVSALVGGFGSACGADGSADKEDSAAEAAGDGSDGADGGDGGAGDDGAGDGADGGDPGGFPADPSPMTVELGGDLVQTLVFDLPTCSHLEGSTSFRQFWRGADHRFVLLVEMIGTFPTVDQVGTWTAEDGVRVKLQEEAGGSGYYFTSDAADPDLALVIDGFDIDEDHVWGTFSVGALSSDTHGSITLSPQPLVLWCSDYN